MQLKSALIALLSTTALASPVAPREAEVKSMMADTPQWTIQSMLRACNSADTSCWWSFKVNTNVAGTAPTPCSMTVANAGATPASQANGGPVTCGPFTITSGWSGQFGPGNGFTVLSVVDYAKKLIVWPAYTDKQLVNGQVVTPDQSYAPQNLP